MNTELTDKTPTRPTGWVFFDGECAFCVRGVERWRPLFGRRGFVWLPLQGVGVAARLGVSEAVLRDEMKLLLADGRVIGGVDSWAALFRTVWWLWPAGALLSVPGIRGLGAVCYRWIARNRHCLGGSCGIHRPKPNHHRHGVFFEMP